MENSKDKQFFQMIKSGFESLAKGLGLMKPMDIGSVAKELETTNSYIKKISEADSRPKISIEINGDGTKTYEGAKGEKGEPGAEPSEERLIELIAPLIPEVKDGKDGKNGEDADEAFITKKVLDIVLPKVPTVEKIMSKIPIPKDGTNGRDGKSVDEKALIKKILDLLPKEKQVNAEDIIRKVVEKKHISYKDLQDLPDIVDIVKKHTEHLNDRLTPRGASSLSQLIDVNLSGLTQDANGNYILGAGAVDSVNGQTGVVVLDTGDIAEATDANYVTDAEKTVIGNTSGTNTGDNATNSQYSGLQAQIDTKPVDDLVVMQALGSSYKAMTYGLAGGEISNSGALSDAQCRFVPVYLKTAQTITGVKWYQKVIGSYTADNNNKVGLYSYSGGTLTLVASSTDDGNLWQTASSETFGTKAFSSTYDAAAGLYFVALLYNTSAQTTAPSIGTGPNLTNAGANLFDFTNSAVLLPNLGSQTDLQASFTMSSAISHTARFWVALY